MIEGQVRLPVSSTRRSAIRYAKLLERVEPHAVDGFAFHGRFLSPGDWIPESSLPEPAILLEGAGSDGHGKKESRYLHILWRYDRGVHGWLKIAEVWTEYWDWALYLGPIACRELEPVRLVPNLASLADRLEGMIEAQMDKLEPGERAQLAAMLHDRWATELARAA